MADPVRRLHVPEPCTADWGAMRGDTKRRFCGSCSKHVHDLSAMTPSEAHEVVAQGSVCVRFRQDAAGNVLHAPKAARRSTRFARAAALGAALLGAGPALAAPAVPPDADPQTATAEPGLLDRLRERLRMVVFERGVSMVVMGDIAPHPPGVEPPVVEPPVIEPPPPQLMGRIAPRPALPPPPPPPPPLPRPEAGQTVIPEVEDALRNR